MAADMEAIAAIFTVALSDTPPPVGAAGTRLIAKEAGVPRRALTPSSLVLAHPITFN